MTDTVAGPGTSRVELAITGMTCASCAARIERKLNRLDGVVASVNYAGETARVDHPGSVDPADLVGAVEHLGYGASLPTPRRGHSTGTGTGGHEADALRRRTLVCAALTVPVVVLAMVPGLPRDLGWLAVALTVGVVAWGGARFHRAAAVNARHGTATMDTLISVGTLAALGWSVYALASGSGHLYLEVAAAVTTFLLAGRWFEARATRRAGAALRALMDLGAPDVAVLRDGVEVRVAVDALTVGEEFVVRPGERIATDGEVVAAAPTAVVDASSVTGESVPVEVRPGDAVVGATIALGSRIVVRATRVGADTQLARIARRVAEAQHGKAAVQRLADRVSAVFVPVVVVLALGTLGAWLLAGGGVEAAVTAAVAVLVVACPCALGLATPTALMVGTGRGAQLGILIRGPEVLETVRRIDTVVLDKTGTVTSGVMRVVDADAVDPRVLRLAGAVEDAASHPIARAVARAAADRAVAGAPLPAATDTRTVDGLGVAGTVEGHEVLVGRPRLLAEHGMALSPALAEAHRSAEAAGTTAVAVGWDGAARGVIAVADTVRDTSASAIRALRGAGVRPMLLTGDHETVARSVAAAVGIDPGDVVAGVLPEEKAATIGRLQREGATVAMVGDGVNDAAALARADLGLAMGTGADVAVEAGDLTLVRGDLQAVPDALRLARRTLATIRGNLFWAFAYNVAALPLAAAGLLDPMVAGAAMALSSAFVVANSLRLRRFRPGPAA